MRPLAVPTALLVLAATLAGCAENAPHDFAADIATHYAEDGRPTTAVQILGVDQSYQDSFRSPEDRGTTTKLRASVAFADGSAVRGNFSVFVARSDGYTVVREERVERTSAPAIAPTPPVSLPPLPTPTPTLTPATPPSPSPSPSPTPLPPTAPLPPTVPTAPTAPTAPPPATERVLLRIGFLNPLSGALENLGPSMQRAMELAVEDVNDASFETGLTVSVVGKEDDTTTDPSVALEHYERLVRAGAEVVVGPCCSGISSSILARSVADGVLLASPSATSPALRSTDRNGLFWRVSSTDESQGTALARLVYGDGKRDANLLVVNNDYGNGFASTFEAEFELQGGRVGTVTRMMEFGANQSAAAAEACAGAPDAIVLVLYSQDAGRSLDAMDATGCRARVGVYASEAVYSPTLSGSAVEEAGRDANGRWVGEGMRGTTPQPFDTSGFALRYRARYGEAPQQYAAEAYDAVVGIALAALVAGSGEGTDVAASLRAVLDTGTACQTFEACAAQHRSGADIDMVGHAHDLPYTTRQGVVEPRSGAFAYWRVEPDGTTTLFRENVIP